MKDRYRHIRTTPRKKDLKIIEEVAATITDQPVDPYRDFKKELQEATDLMLLAETRDEYEWAEKRLCSIRKELDRRQNNHSGTYPLFSKEFD